MITFNNLILAICNNKIQMFALGRELGLIKDQLSIENAESFLKDLQTIIFFVNNVPIKGPLRDYNQIGFLKAGKMFEKAAHMYGVKIITPLRTLLLRVLDQNLGFIELHTFFLLLCNTFSVPKQALPILQRPALFRNISKNKISQLLVQGCDIYIKLGQHSKAYELIQRGRNLQFLELDNTVRLYSRIIVLQLNLGYQIQSDIIDRLKFLLLKLDNSIDTSMSEQVKQSKIFIIQFYASLKSYRKLTEIEERILNMDGLLQVYQNSKWSSLRKYIANDIKKNNWRIKAQSIKETPVSALDVITGINKNGQIYRYDCKNKIMYFNHKESDQEKLNSLISLAMNMSEEVSNCKIERKERDILGGRGMKMGMFGFPGMGVRHMGAEFFK